jgi:hypothetical protein
MEGTCANLPETGAGATDSSVEQGPEVDPAWGAWQHVNCAAGGQMFGVREPWGCSRQPFIHDDACSGASAPRHAIDVRSPQGSRPSRCSGGSRPGGRVRRGPVGNPSPTPSAGVGARKRAGFRPGRRGGTTGGQRPQRCGSAADEDQTFEGLYAARIQVDPSPSGTDRPAARRGCFGSRRLAVVKRSEPHVRYRDATSPDPAVRRKPPRWCKTTRAERDAVGWQPWPDEASPDASGVDRRGMPEKGTSKDRVRGRQDLASFSKRAFACAEEARGDPVAHRARRTRGEGDGGGCLDGNARTCLGRKTLESHWKR